MTRPRAGSTSYDGIVLAGGRSRRMDVADKTRLVVGGRSLLDRVLAALDGAASVVVVGEERPTERAVTWTREMPVGGGPVPALAAGLGHVTAPVTVLLAGDLPFLDAQHVRDLVDAVAADDGDGAYYVDSTGQPQWLCSAWRTDALHALPLDGGALRRAVEELRARVLPAPSAERPLWFDCDTPDDVRTAEELLT